MSNVGTKKVHNYSDSNKSFTQVIETKQKKKKKNKQKKKNNTLPNKKHLLMFTLIFNRR